MQRSHIAVPLVMLALCTLFATGSALAKTHTFTLDKVYKIDPGGTIHMSTNDADVKIVGSDRSDVHIVVNYERVMSGLGKEFREGDFEVVVSEEKGSLRIRERHGDSGYIGFMTHVRESYDISIEAPRTVGLKVDADDDDYTVHDIDGPISISLEDGQASLADCNGTSFFFDVEDGDIEMTGGSGSLETTTEDGEVYVEKGAFSSIHATTEDGELTIGTTLSDDGTYRLRSDDGRIKFTVLGGGGEFTVDYDDMRPRASGAFEQIDHDEGYSLYKLKGGNARVHLRTEDGSIHLRTK